jgi:NAD(P)-dependent dehydrogenase (short-subunit alcohol dehydrogenase family)
MRTIAELMNLAGRRTLVTGGAGYIGSAAVESLIELGATVGILDVDAEACEKTVDRLNRARPGAAMSIPCDLRDEQATRAAVRVMIKQLGGLDVFVHCAAYVGTTQVPGWAVSFEEQSVAAWEAAFRVNLTSAFVAVQEAKTALAASGHGSVIFVSSTYGMVGPDMRLYEGTQMGRQPAGYAASKGGLIQLARYLATVLAPHVRVNVVTPGGVWRGQPELFHQRYVTRTPLGRMAAEEDMKGALVYLASDLSAYVTGHNLVVDGGWTVW